MHDKLDILVEIEGFDSLEQLLAAAVMDSICPGICINSGCDYTTEVEPDQDRGYCETCRTQTIKSALILAEII